jgi:hypothetical protein
LLDRRRAVVRAASDLAVGRSEPEVGAEIGVIGSAGVSPASRVIL